MLCATVTLVHICVSVGGWVECLFCTLNVLECHPFIAVHSFSALWMICRLYTQKLLSIFVFLRISHSIPMAVYFWPQTTQVWLFSLRPFSFFESSPRFCVCVCVCVWSHSDCHQSHQVSYHSDEVAILSRSKMTQQHQRANCNPISPTVLATLRSWVWFPV